MTAPERLIGEPELQAYVDDQLDPDLRGRVEQYLRARPDVAERVAADKAQRDALRAAFAGLPRQPLAAELGLNALIEQRLRPRHAAWRVAAVIVLSLGVGAAGGWLLHLQPVPDRAAVAMSLLQHEALASHSVYATDRSHPIEMAGTERDQLAHWLSGRLNRTVVPPDLSAFGYRLMGGRLLATEQGHPAALFIYQDDSGNRISLLMRPMAPEFHVPIVDSDRDDVNLCSWIAGGMGYSVLGRMSDDQLDRIAHHIGGQRS